MTQRVFSKAAAILFLLAVGVQGAANAQVGNNTDVLNPNTAGEEQLAAVPHLTAALVGQIVEARPFLSATALNDVLSGALSEEQIAEVFPRLFLPINLNEASEEEILLVPGVGNRMAHEFDEYRPYVAIAVWRREMGKYVDDDEVARMEQFVFVPIDLNTASDEDILSIPGLGSRMLREFKEYRPYVNIAQFRREMGKYVDDGEVARLERYVKVN
jgi:DNA uptake protein ComE-like DNA-binding protein